MGGSAAVRAALPWGGARCSCRGRALSRCGDRCVATRGCRALRGQRGDSGKLAAALVSAEERRPEAARRERFAVGRVRGRDFGSDRPTAGPDLGRNGCRTAQATDQNQPQLALGVSRPTQHHAQKSAASSRTAASRCGASAPPLVREQLCCPPMVFRRHRCRELETEIKGSQAWRPVCRDALGGDTSGPAWSKR